MNITEKSPSVFDAGTGLFAIFVTQNNQGGAMHYTLKDHQGNLTATVCGNTVERLSYDAWGRRRNPNGFCYDNVSYTFDRGYTLHEHYDDFGLINMNGRMYDPVISSFLSVDRYVQQPDNSQGFNRYAYCMYNPLRYTDPSGWVYSRPEWNGAFPPPDGDEFDNYIPGVITSGGYSIEYNAYTYSCNLNEVTVSASRYTWAEDQCRNLTWNERESHSQKFSDGQIILSGGGTGGSGGFNYSRSWNDIALSSTDVPVAPEMHMVYSQVFTYDGIVSPNPSKFIRIDAGQHVKVEIKNMNIVGVLVNIQDETTYHYTKTLLGLPKTMYTGESHSFWLFPGNSISYDFYRFDYVPITWLFEISTNSDAASVRVIFYSE